MDKQAPLEAAGAAFARDPRIAAAVVFGSVVRGHARADSDLDVGVLYRDEAARQAVQHDMLNFLGALSIKAGRVVHLVDLARADSALRRTVFSTGRVLLDRSAGALRALEYRTAVEYADWAYARAVIDAGHRRQLGLAHG